MYLAGFSLEVDESPVDFCDIYYDNRAHVYVLATYMLSKNLKRFDTVSKTSFLYFLSHLI